MYMLLICKINLNVNNINMKIFTVFIISNVCNIVCNIAMSIIVPFYP